MDNFKKKNGSDKIDQLACAYGVVEVWRVVRWMIVEGELFLGCYWGDQLAV